MNTLILCESFFGNTSTVAQVIADALSHGTEVRTKAVSDVTPTDLQGVNLLIVGSATRGFRPSPATQKFLQSLKPGSLENVDVAAFNTRIDLNTLKSRIFRWIVNIGGYATKPIAQVLAKKGGVLKGEHIGFLVLDKEGPLAEGELERVGQ